MKSFGFPRTVYFRGYEKKCFGKVKTATFNSIQDIFIWYKVFKNGPNKICGSQTLTKITWPILEYLDSFVSRTNFVQLFQFSFNVFIISEIIMGTQWRIWDIVKHL